MSQAYWRFPKGIPNKWGDNKPGFLTSNMMNGGNPLVEFGKRIKPYLPWRKKHFSQRGFERVLPHGSHSQRVFFSQRVR